MTHLQAGILVVEVGIVALAYLVGLVRGGIRGGPPPA